MWMAISSEVEDGNDTSHPVAIVQVSKFRSICLVNGPFRLLAFSTEQTIIHDVVIDRVRLWIHPEGRRTPSGIEAVTGQRRSQHRKLTEAVDATN